MNRRNVFNAIADPTRRAIIAILAHGALNLNAIADQFTMSRPAVSQHIKILTECGLVEIKKKGRERFCELQLQPLKEVEDWIAPFRKTWTENFNRLDDVLSRLQEQ